MKDIFTLRLDDRSLKEIRGVPLGNIFSGMEALAQQPPLEVSDLYKKAKIDYERGYKSVSVRAESGRPLHELSYTVIDYAYVKGSGNKLNQVGMKRYTQKEVDELTGQIDTRIRGPEQTD